MNLFHQITNQNELEQLIERYFDSETSIQEEKMLRGALAHCKWSSEVIDEARFAMGYFAAHSQESQRATKRNNHHPLLGIAASIAIIIAAGGYALWHQQQPSDVCIAYVNGKVVKDNDKVMTLVANDMSKMDNAANAMVNQLSSLGEAIELDNE